MGWDGSLNCGVIQSYRYLVGGQQLRINPAGGEVRIGYGDSGNSYLYRDLSWADGTTYSSALGNTPIMSSGRGVNDTTIPLYWFPLASNYVGLRNYVYQGYNGSGGITYSGAGPITNGATYGQTGGIWQQMNIEWVYVLNPSDTLPRTLTVVFTVDDYGTLIVNNRFLHHQGSVGTITRYFYITDPYIRVSASVFNSAGFGTCQIAVSW